MIRWFRALSPVQMQLLGYAAAACALCSFLALGSGIWIGKEWAEGRAAQAQTKTLERDLTAAMDAVRKAQGAAAAISRDMEAASTRLNQFSKGLADDVERNRRTASVASAQLEAALARNRSLAATAVDADLLQAWNLANAGDPAGAAGADGATAGDRPRPAGAMPGQPAARDGRIDRRTRP
jgi:biopolymer transport protein ExbB/TolQ